VLLNEVAWLAGLFEGEGCIVVSRKKGKTSPSIALKLAMTDEDVVTHAATLWGTRVSRTVREKPFKTVFVTTVWGENAAAWLADFFPYLGSRRQAKALEALIAFANGRPHAKLTDFCKRGHPVVEPGSVYRSKTGRTWCRRCKLDRAKEGASMGRSGLENRQVG
jgi:hypothetical protein